MLNQLELYNMTSRMGKLKAIDRFDGAFFGIMSRIGDTIDPQARILLETTYEAIVDAGIDWVKKSVTSVVCAADWGKMRLIII